MADGAAQESEMPFTRRGRGAAVDWEKVPFGSYDDATLARRFHVTRQAVCTQRRARKIAPFSGRVLARDGLSAVEREDLALLELGVDHIADLDRPTISLTTAEAVRRTPGWRVDTHRSAREDGHGRATAFRFCLPGARAWTSRMSPATARTFLLIHLWPEAAERRIEELRREPEGAPRSRKGAP